MSSETGKALKNRLRMLSIPGVLNADKPDAVNSQEGIPVDTANVEVPEVSPSGMVGPRGIDTSGRVRVRHIGVPPAHQPGAGQQEFTTRKDRAYPFPVPPQLARSNPITPAANSGEVHNTDLGWMAHGMVVDNYTNIWLYLVGASIYVPPNTIRFAFPLPAGVGHLKWNAEAPPGIVQPALTANTMFEFTASETPVDYSPGIATNVSTSGGGGAGGAVLNTGIPFTESTATLAGGATFNGTGHDTGLDTPGTAASMYSRFRVKAYSDQAGTINIQYSPDNATWRTTLSQAVGAAAATVVESIVSDRYVRVSYTNGASIQTVFDLRSALVSI